MTVISLFFFQLSECVGTTFKSYLEAADKNALQVKFYDYNYPLYYYISQEKKDIWINIVFISPLKHI